MNNTDQIEEITKLMCKFKQEPYEPLPCEKCCYNDTCHYQSIAKELQKADFVKVVRCKDCQHWGRYVGRVGSPNGHCFLHNTNIDGFDFCNYGKRREGHDS